MFEKITNDDLWKRLKDIEEFVKFEYIPNHPKSKRDFAAYEAQLLSRLKSGVKKLKPLIRKAVSTLEIENSGRGRPKLLCLEDELTILLVKHLCRFSNRLMSCALLMFSLLRNIDVSYKTIERIYSDERVGLALHNLHALILREKNVQNISACGDGTGFSLTISKHYYSEIQKLKDDAKQNGDRKAFVYSFKILDLTSNMYVAFGTSLKSEREAYDKALEMVQKLGIHMNDIRLDKYYSCPSTQEDFPNSKVYVIPKSNAVVNGTYAYKESLSEFTHHTYDYLLEYYRREKSEAGWSADKRRTGWMISQRLPERINRADFCNLAIHNLFSGV